MTRQMSLSLTAVTFAMTAATLVFPARAAGQSLHLAELFVEQGRLDDARAEVGAWFEIRGEAATDDEVQHGLWLQGRLSEDRTAARNDLEQLATRYPEGPYTALALTWLADAAAQEGNESAAMAYQARVVEDFPESEAAATARDWLEVRGLSVAPAATERAPAENVASARPPVMAGAATDSQSAATAEPEVVRPPARADTAGAPAAAVEEVVDTAAIAAANSTALLDSLSSLAAAAAEPPADTTPPAAEPIAVEEAPVDDPPVEVSVAEEPAAEAPAAIGGPAVPGAADGGAFAVQIGAFRNADGAAGLVDDLIAAGFDARLVGVPDSSLFRVRIGRYGSLEEAGTELGRVREAGHDGAVVNDARRELVVSR